MGAIGPTGFIFRDFIKYILPTLIAVGLFAPLLLGDKHKESLEWLIFAAFILAYIIHAPISELSSAFANLAFPLVSRHYASYREQSDWWREKWDYDVLWSLLEKDDREYAYLTQSYLEFYRTVGFYLAIYAAVAAAWLVADISEAWPRVHQINDFLCQLWGSRIAVMGGWEWPTVLVLALAPVLMIFLLQDSVTEYAALLGDGGFYEKFAARFQASHGGIAKAIWGRVLLPGDGAPGAGGAFRISLRVDGRELAQAETDTHGRFQFVGLMRQCIDQKCAIHAERGQWRGTVERTLSTTSVPIFEILVSDGETQQGSDQVQK